MKNSDQMHQQIANTIYSVVVGATMGIIFLVLTRGLSTWAAGRFWVEPPTFKEELSQGALESLSDHDFKTCPTCTKYGNFDESEIFQDS